MEPPNYSTRTRTFRQVSAEARLKELHSLQVLVQSAAPITHPLLQDWVSVTNDRAALLTGSVWGGIRWPKSLGRPKTPSITSGFEIVHQFKKLEFVDQGGGHYKDISTWKIQPAPSVWDASTSSEYRVAFMFFAGGGGINPNRLTVSLAPVSWEISLLAGNGYLNLDPYAYGDFGSLGERVVFPDFVVKHRPYSLVSSVQPLGPALDAEVFKQPVT